MEAAGGWHLADPMGDDEATKMVDAFFTMGSLCQLHSRSLHLRRSPAVTHMEILQQKPPEHDGSRSNSQAGSRPSLWMPITG